MKRNLSRQKHSLRKHKHLVCGGETPITPTAQGAVAYNLLSPSAQEALEIAAYHPNPESVFYKSPQYVSPSAQGAVAYNLLSPSAQEALKIAAYHPNPEKVYYKTPEFVASPYTQGEIAYNLLSPTARKAMWKQAEAKSPIVLPSPIVSSESPTSFFGVPKLTKLTFSEDVPKPGAWIRPSDETIRREQDVEYINHAKFYVETYFKMDVFPIQSLFVETVQTSPTVQWTQSMNIYTKNRSNCKSKKCLLDLIKTYKSYPTYRNESTLDALEERIQSEEPLDMPIVLKFSQKNYRVLSGNTRLDMALILRKPIQVVLVDLQAIVQSRFEYFPQADQPIETKEIGSIRDFFPLNRCSDIKFTEDEDGDVSIFQVEFLPWIYLFEQEKDKDQCSVKKLIPASLLTKIQDTYIVTPSSPNTNSIDPFLQFSEDAMNEYLVLVQKGETLFDYANQLRKTCKLQRELGVTAPWYKTFDMSILRTELAPYATIVLPASDIQMILKDDSNELPNTVFQQEGFRLDFDLSGNITFRDTELARKKYFKEKLFEFYQEKQLSESEVFRVNVGPSIQLDRFANVALLNVTHMPPHIIKMMERFLAYIDDKQRLYNETLRKALEPSQIKFADQDLDAELVTNIVTDFLTLANQCRELGIPTAARSYRGFTFQKDETWQNVYLKTGNTLSLDSFVSTSLSPRVAKQFASSKSNAIFVEFDLDSTVPQINVNALLRRVNCTKCSMEGEEEILLVPNIKPRVMFIVQKVEKVTSESLQSTSFKEFAKILLESYDIKNDREPIWKKGNFYFVRLVPYHSAQRSKLLGGRKKL